MQYLGTPYVWAGSSPGGFDCSGLVMYAYSQVGVSLPHSSYAMWGDGVSVPKDQLQPGDIVFFDGLGHVGIYIGGGEFVHAPHTGTVVQVSSLDSGSYAASYDGARRVASASAEEPRPRARKRGSPALDFFLLMRTTWNGSISFGLVSIPVGLSPATATSARQSDVQFKLLHRECLTPIKQKRWCPVHDVELAPDEIVRGWEAAKGQFVPVEDDELEALESLDTSRAIEIRQFVPAGEVDPIYFDRTYFLVPAATEAQRRPYALLARGDARVRTSSGSGRSCSPARRSSA